MEIGIIILLFLIFGSGFFSASETALFSLSSTKIKAYQISPDPKKRLIARLVLEPRDLLVTIFMLNTLVNILIQNTASNMYGETASWLLKVGVPFLLMLFLGELIPKYVGLQNNIQLANIVAPSINFFQNLLRPIRKIIVDITVPVSRLLFFYLKREQDISADELKHVLQTSQEFGVLQADEAELVRGYLKFQDATVKELMRPREDILYYDINDPLSKLTYLFVEQKCSRLPVCDKSIDHILGIITVQQYFLHRRDIPSSATLIPYLDKPFYIPEATQAKALVRRFDENKQVLAMVVDEYGSITGLITREDLVEEVVGEISDLRDTKALYTKTGTHEIIANARLELSEFNEIFNVNLRSESNLLTIGGWLIEQVDGIPKSGARFELHGFIFQVLASDPNKLRRLYIRKLNVVPTKLPKKEKKKNHS